MLSGTKRHASGSTDPEIDEANKTSPTWRSVGRLAGRVVPGGGTCRIHAGGVVLSSLHLRRQAAVETHTGSLAESALGAATRPSVRLEDPAGCSE